MKPLTALLSGLLAVPVGRAQSWPADWLRALARARAVYEIPSRYPLPIPTRRLGEPGRVRAEMLRKRDLELGEVSA